MGRIVVITGGSSGIGKAAAKLFAEKGCTVYELSRSGRDEGAVSHITADVTSQSDVESAMRAVYQREGRIDLLVNNAGMGVSGAAEFTDIADARRIMDVNFYGVFICTAAALPYLRNSDNPRIINISSVAAAFAIPFQAFYSASKAAVNALSLAMANELRPFGIKVSAIMPGDAATGFTAARQKSELGDSLYGNAIRKAVAGMERDEENGMSPERLAAFICKVADKKSPAPLYTAGGKYKLFVFLQKLLPTRFYNWVVGKLYG